MPDLPPEDRRQERIRTEGHLVDITGQTRSELRQNLQGFAQQVMQGQQARAADAPPPPPPPSLKISEASLPAIPSTPIPPRDTPINYSQQGIPAFPADDGDYFLHVKMDSGTPVLDWVKILDCP